MPQPQPGPQASPSWAHGLTFCGRISYTLPHCPRLGTPPALHPPLHPGTPLATTSCPVCCPDPPTRGAVPWRSGLYWTQDKGRREEWQMVCPLAPAILKDYGEDFKLCKILTISPSRLQALSRWKFLLFCFV